MKEKEVYAFVMGENIGLFFSIVEINQEEIIIIHLPSLINEIITFEELTILIKNNVIERVDDLPDDVFVYLVAQTNSNYEKNYKKYNEEHFNGE